ncbi:hypothetical protein ACJMK2_026686 [Sinanodonta woodiana]|uniref:Histone-binding protein RBBP4-like N-terminal domain-containing protein n=1 Tax=Sinanodonta woodiana TaxID=1069815 RepID=A0ABD3XKT6_SINWO
MEQNGWFHEAEEEQMCSEDNIILGTEEYGFKDLLWLPDATRPEGEDYFLHQLILGTQTESGQQNYLVLANVQIPDENPRCHDLDYDDKSVNWKVEIQMKMNHEGRVNKACFMPQKPCIIATQISYGDVLIFDSTKQPSENDPSGKCSPELTLKGHGQVEYGLSWNPIINGYLVSASYDHAIRVWDINSMFAKKGVIGAIATVKEHSSVVNDVAWHPFYQNMFGSVGNDESLMIWDTRLYRTAHIVRAHAAAVNCLAFNPYREFILATGSADETIALWDLRNLKSALFSIESHKDAIIQLQWSPHNEKLLASSGRDQRLYVWDISDLGAEQSTDNPTDDPTELLSIRCEHNGDIFEFSWNPNERRVICSVIEENIVQFWKMAEHDYYIELWNYWH